MEEPLLRSTAVFSFYIFLLEIYKSKILGYKLSDKYDDITEKEIQDEHHILMNLSRIDFSNSSNYQRNRLWIGLKSYIKRSPNDLEDYPEKRDELFQIAFLICTINAAGQSILDTDRLLLFKGIHSIDSRFYSMLIDPVYNYIKYRFKKPEKEAFIFLERLSNSIGYQCEIDLCQTPDAACSFANASREHLSLSYDLARTEIG